MSNTTLHEPLDGSLCRTAATCAPTRAQALLLHWTGTARPFPLLAAMLLVGLLVMLGACGQKGALFIPGPDGKPLQPAAITAASAPAAPAAFTAASAPSVSPAAPVPAPFAPSRSAP